MIGQFLEDFSDIFSRPDPSGQTTPTPQDRRTPCNPPRGVGQSAITPLRFPEPASIFRNAPTGRGGKRSGAGPGPPPARGIEYPLPPPARGPLYHAYPPHSENRTRRNPLLSITLFDGELIALPCGSCGNGGVNRIAGGGDVSPTPMLGDPWRHSWGGG